MRALTASRSPSVKRARACGERTTRIHSASAGASSAPNVSVPATFGQPSTRGRRAPTARQARAGSDPSPTRASRSTSAEGSDPAPRPSPPRRSSDSRCSGRARRRAHPRPARAARRGVAREADRPRPSACRACRCRTAPRRARGRRGAAGRSAPPGPRPSTVSIAAPSACAVGTRQAQTCCAVEQHGAGAAVAGLAADLGAGEPELVAQRVGERRERRGAETVTGRAVEREATPVGASRVRARVLHQAALRRAALGQLAEQVAHQRQRRLRADRRPSRGCRRWARARRDAPAARGPRAAASGCAERAPPPAPAGAAARPSRRRRRRARAAMRAGGVRLDQRRPP